MAFKRKRVTLTGGRSVRPRVRRTWRRRAAWRRLPRRLAFRRSRIRYTRFRRRYHAPSRAAKSEVKKIPLQPLDQQRSWQTSIPFVTTQGVCLGLDNPNAWNIGSLTTQTITPMGGMATTQGLTQENRIGSKTFMKHTILRMNVVMDYTNDPRAKALPVEFRCVVFKTRQGNGPQPSDTVGTQLAPNPYLRFFRRIIGNERYGPGTLPSLFWPSVTSASGDDTNFMNPSIFSRALINTTDIRVYKDFKFTLGPPVLEDSLPTHPNIPINNCHKTIQFKLKHNRRAEHGPVGLYPAGTPVQPYNFDWRYSVVVFAYWQNAQFPPPPTTADDNGPSNFSINWSGITTFTDA